METKPRCTKAFLKLLIKVVDTKRRWYTCNNRTTKVRRANSRFWRYGWGTNIQHQLRANNFQMPSHRQDL